LKDINQFQGARYEIYVTASFVRAGFEVELENETERTTSHCEFTATHRTGAKYSVEAKSRHRQGILGREGVAPSFDFTNHAYHYVSAETPEPGKVAVFTGINIPDFKRGPNTGVEVVGAAIIATKALSEKYPALKELSESVFNHTKMPQAFEGDDAWHPRRA
jgi:hypothetical protein